MGVEKLGIPLLKKWLGSIAWTLFLWANDMIAEDYWREIALQEVAMFPEFFAEQLNNGGLSSITEQPCYCPCGWVGTVWDCEPDVDGGGSLGCPECSKIIEVIVSRSKMMPA